MTKPIRLEPALAIQAIRTTVNDIGLVIENRRDTHMLRLTPQQAADLAKQLATAAQDAIHHDQAQRRETKALAEAAETPEDE